MQILHLVAILLAWLHDTETCRVAARGPVAHFILVAFVSGLEVVYLANAEDFLQHGWLDSGVLSRETADKVRVQRKNKPTFINNFEKGRFGLDILQSELLPAR